MIVRIALVAGALVAIALVVREIRANDTEPVPWSKVEEAIARPVGSVTRTTTMRKGRARGVVVYRMWVAYDFKRKLIEDRYGGGDDPDTRKIELPTTRAAAPTRFLSTPKRQIVWNPEAKCRSPWLETGIPTKPLFSGLIWPDPAWMLRRLRSTPMVVGNDARATVYRVAVEAASALGASPLLMDKRVESLELSDKLDKLDKERTMAMVRVPRGDGSIDVTVDLKRFLRLVGESSPGYGESVKWSLDLTPPAVDVVLPTKVAPSDCFIRKRAR